MTADQWELADLAKNLYHLYRELDRHKQEKAQAPRGERVLKPAPGPRDPGNGWAISLEAELSADLFEMTRDALNHTSRRTHILSQHGYRCCAVIRTNSMEIVEQFPAVEDLEELMHDQVKTLIHELQPKDIDQVINRPEPRQRAEVILQRLARMGHSISPTTLRTWASKGHITTELRDNRGTYLMTEVLAWVTRDTHQVH